MSMRKYLRLARELILNWNPSQPRDRKGRWGKGGFGNPKPAKSNPVVPKGIAGASVLTKEEKNALGKEGFKELKSHLSSRRKLNKLKKEGKATKEDLDKIKEATRRIDELRSEAARRHGGVDRFATKRVKKLDKTEVVTPPKPLVVPPPRDYTPVDYQHRDASHPVVKDMMANHELTRKVAEFHSWAKANDSKLGEAQKAFTEADSAHVDAAMKLYGLRGNKKPKPFTPEYDKLNAEYKRTEKVRDETQDKLLETRAGSDARKKLVETFGVPNPMQVSSSQVTRSFGDLPWKADPFTLKPNDHQVKIIKDSEAFVSSLTSHPSVVRINHAESASGRAYCDGGEAIQLIAHGRQMLSARDPLNTYSTEAATATSVHELGHAIEHTKPLAQHQARRFLEYRTAGEQAKPLNEVTGASGYADWEKGRKDQFDRAFEGSAAYYVGKHYDHGATEVISMGVEKLWKDPVGFVTKDPEYFHFILHVLGTPDLPY